MKKTALFLKGILAVSLAFTLILAACDSSGEFQTTNITTDTPQVTVEPYGPTATPIGFKISWPPVKETQYYEVWRNGPNGRELIDTRDPKILAENQINVIRNGVGNIEGRFPLFPQTLINGRYVTYDIVDYYADGFVLADTNSWGDDAGIVNGKFTRGEPKLKLDANGDKIRTLEDGVTYTYEVVAIPRVGTRDSSTGKKDGTIATYAAPGTKEAGAPVTFEIDGDYQGQNKRAMIVTVTPPTSGIIMPDAQWAGKTGWSTAQFFDFQIIKMGAGAGQYNPPSGGYPGYSEFASWYIDKYPTMGTKQYVYLLGDGEGNDTAWLGLDQTEWAMQTNTRGTAWNQYGWEKTKFQYISNGYIDTNQQEKRVTHERLFVHGYPSARTITQGTFEPIRTPSIALTQLANGDYDITDSNYARASWTVTNYRNTINLVDVRGVPGAAYVIQRQVGKNGEWVTIPSTEIEYGAEWIIGTDGAVDHMRWEAFDNEKEGGALGIDMNGNFTPQRFRDSGIPMTALYNEVNYRVKGTKGDRVDTVYTTGNDLTPSFTIGLTVELDTTSLPGTTEYWVRPSWNNIETDGVLGLLGDNDYIELYYTRIKYTAEPSGGYRDVWKETFSKEDIEKAGSYSDGTLMDNSYKGEAFSMATAGPAANLGDIPFNELFLCIRAILYIDSAPQTAPGTIAITNGPDAALATGTGAHSGPSGGWLNQPASSNTLPVSASDGHEYYVLKYGNAD